MRSALNSLHRKRRYSLCIPIRSFLEIKYRGLKPEVEHTLDEVSHRQHPCSSFRCSPLYLTQPRAIRGKRQMLITQELCMKQNYLKAHLFLHLSSPSIHSKMTRFSS